MASMIDTIQFISVRGPFQQLTERIETFSRPGVDASEFRKIGTRAEPFVLTTVCDYENATTRLAAWYLYKALVTKTVTISDDNGIAWVDMLIKNVQMVSQRAGATGVGGVNNGAYMLTAQWEVQNV